MNDDLRYSVVLITPQTAQAMLRGNTGNRHLSPARVEHYARMMREGLWTISNDAICVSPEGRLLNGQHRLSAIVMTGVAVRMPVMENVTEAAFKNMDQGRKRSVSDNTHLPRELVADAKFLFALINPSKAPSPAEIEEVAAWWRPAWDALAPYGLGETRKKINNVSFRIGAGFRWAISPRKDRDIILMHTGQVAASELENAPKAVWALWRRLADGNYGNSVMARLQRALVIFYYLDPKKADIHPLVRNEEIALKEMRQIAQALPDLYIAGPARDGHPYAPYDMPKLDRPLSGSALLNRLRKTGGHE
jgi:hypothetical protein